MTTWFRLVSEYGGRMAALQHRVSKGTVIQAYAALEAQGLIEAKAQSGFFVRPRAQTGQPLPQTSLKRPSVVRSERVAATSSL
ncbi:MAG: GntR family transcriptional regulator [Burkholderiaceae bacterium]|nr:GntR family transcriptional regulator [Burkholderiaceae bacterium]